ncbi:MAG: hypothetical protein DBX47_03645 [Clostridiales bacterium]|nr:MAG: hypothetical protein DBX47_03645 [Clostridiales bacterium]
MQFVLRNDYISLQIESIEISDLISCGAKITAQDIEIFREHYVELTTTSNNVFEPGWYPDALIPIKYDTKPFNVKKGENQAYWITVHTAIDQPSGIYTGTVTLTISGRKLEIPVSATVWDFAVPTENHVQSSYGLWDMGHYKGQYEQYYNFFMKYRQSPLDLPPYTASSAEDYVSYLKTYADNEAVPCFRINIDVRKNDNGDYYVTDNSKRVLLLIRQQGFMDKCFLYIDDEPTYDKYPEIIKKYKAIGAVAPDLGIVLPITTYIPNEFISDINRFCIKHTNVSANQIDFIHSIGNHVWWYNCNFPAYPSPTLHISDYLLSSRVMAWMQKDYKLDGFLYWAATIAFKYINGITSERNIWVDPYIDVPEMPAGDGYLVYQGYENDGVINENVPIPTIRLESLRDGFEDYEYLILLENKIRDFADKNGFAINVDEAMQNYYDSLYKTPTSYYTDDSRITAVRKILAADIMSNLPFLAYANTVDGIENTQLRKITVYSSAQTVNINGISYDVKNGCAETIVKVDETIPINKIAVEADGVKHKLSVFVRRSLESDLIIDSTDSSFNTNGITASENGLTFDFSQKSRLNVLPQSMLVTDWAGKTHIRMTLSTPDGSDTPAMDFIIYVGSSAVNVPLGSYKNGAIVEFEIPSNVLNSQRVNSITKIGFSCSRAVKLTVKDVSILIKE